MHVVHSGCCRHARRRWSAALLPAFENERRRRSWRSARRLRILEADNGRLFFRRFARRRTCSAPGRARRSRRLADQIVDEFSANTFSATRRSPNFPYAAATWLSMWQNRFHQRLDGAIATDPTALVICWGRPGRCGFPTGRSSCLHTSRGDRSASFCRRKAARPGPPTDNERGRSVAIAPSSR